MSNRLYVGNLSFDSTAESVRASFSAIGEVTDVHVVTDRETGRSRGFAFLEMETDDQGASAMQAMVDQGSIRLEEVNSDQQNFEKLAREYTLFPMATSV